MRAELNSDNPECLFQLDGNFIKKDKSILMHTLEENIPLATNAFSDGHQKMLSLFMTAWDSFNSC